MDPVVTNQDPTGPNSIRRGKFIVFITVSLLLLIDAVFIGSYISTIGTARLPQQFVRFCLTLLLGVFLSEKWVHVFFASEFYSLSWDA